MPDGLDFGIIIPMSKHMLLRVWLVIIGGWMSTGFAALPPERQELLPLPAGSIVARGWMRTMLERGRAGMGGHFGEFDPDQFEKPGRTKDYDARLPGSGWKENPGWCSEQSGQYRLGQIELAETLDDAGLRAKYRDWRDAFLAGQESDGYLGTYRPQDDRKEDYNAWGAHFHYRSLLVDYSRTRDPRTLEALHRGLLWFAREWTGTNKTDYVGPTILWPAVEVYRLTGDERLRAFCEDYAAWLNANPLWNPHRPHSARNTGSFDDFSMELGAYHVVAFAVRAQLPGICWLANGNRAWRDASVKTLENHLARVGWQVTGVPVSDRERTSFPSCVGETEYCNCLCWMEYLQWLSRLTGDARYGDRIERMTFNAAMGARKKDERAVAYNTAPNQFRATRDSAAAACEKYYGVYCPCEHAACCTVQSIRLLPSYLLTSVMKTRRGDLAVNVYGPCRVTTPEVTLESETDYPFDLTVRYRVTPAKETWTRSLRLRKPSWATDVTVTRDGAAVVPAETNGWLVLEGPWRVGEVTVAFGAEPVVRAVRERDLVEPTRAVEYGPLVFAQPMKETWTAVPQHRSSRPLPESWTWFDVTCAEKPVIYAMPLSTAFGKGTVRVKRTPNADYPWENPPVRLVVPLVRASAAYPVDPELQQHTPLPLANPVPADIGATPEDVEFVPVGATNLRLTCFPLAVRP